MTDAETPDIRAAEYVLRLLSPADERAFEEALPGDAAMRARVVYWANRLAGMNIEIDPVAPPAKVRRALMERLFGEPEKKPPFWQRVGMWQAISAASVAVAAFFGVQSMQPSLAPGLISEIAAEDDSLRVLAVVIPSTHVIQLTRTAGEPAEGRVFELWGLPPDGGAPVSLGVLPEGPTASIQVPDALLGFPATQLTLAISDEPTGGSPTGAPTGDVLALGQITSL
ncbi:anti-sigma factor [Thalassococcus sp. BH17M4-6]|uniref:anti-sigma factor n=1 Tax=Thalassococcus sp. BH17M4-6 TaxID=3413148 RepID=UPI003BC581DD